jgi:hypothetical protein
MAALVLVLLLPCPHALVLLLPCPHALMLLLPCPHSWWGSWEQ